MGLTCLPSQANFLLVIDPPSDAPALVDTLLRQGVIVRPMTGFGLPNALRVTVGLPEQNERFLAALRTALAEVVAAPV
jgi:histidinol-phosphate aminotransferase